MAQARRRSRNASDSQSDCGAQSWGDASFYMVANAHGGANAHGNPPPLLVAQMISFTVCVAFTQVFCGFDWFASALIRFTAAWSGFQ